MDMQLPTLPFARLEALQRSISALAQLTEEAQRALFDLEEAAEASAPRALALRRLGQARALVEGLERELDALLFAPRPRPPGGA